MSTDVADLTQHRSRRRFRSVELAKRHERDTWALADAVYADVLDELPDREDASSPFGKSGPGAPLRRAEDVVEAAHRKEGTEVSRSYLHDLFVTARAWPPDVRRPELAGFGAHYDLRGQEFKNRAAILERLAAKSSTGRVARQQVRLWKADRKPVAHRTFLELVERRLRRALKAAGNPWHTVAQGDRDKIARILRTIATEVENGTFPGPRD